MQESHPCMDNIICSTCTEIHPNGVMLEFWEKAGGVATVDVSLIHF